MPPGAGWLSCAAPWRAVMVVIKIEHESACGRMSSVKRFLARLSRVLLSHEIVSCVVEDSITVDRQKGMGRTITIKINGGAG